MGESTKGQRLRSVTRTAALSRAGTKKSRQLSDQPNSVNLNRGRLACSEEVAAARADDGPQKHSGGVIPSDGGAADVRRAGGDAAVPKVARDRGATVSGKAPHPTKEGKIRKENEEGVNRGGAERAPEDEA